MVGTVTISVELELAWGFHDLPGSRAEVYISEDRSRETEYLSRLLDLCDSLDVPVTFDVVGHLLLSECDGPHVDGPESPYPPDWFEADPGTDASLDPLYYAPDFAEMVQSADADHEICTHTFSHVLAEHLSADALTLDLEMARAVHRDTGTDLSSSIVLPRHEAPPEGLLSEFGFDCVRVPFYDHRELGPWRHKGKVASRVLGRRHAIADPGMRDEVLETYCAPEPTLTAPFLRNGGAGPHPIFRPIPLAVRQKLQERYLVSGALDAAERDSYVHYWTHLYNLSNREQWKPIRLALRRLKELQRRGTIDIETMEALRRRVPA